MRTRSRRCFYRVLDDRVVSGRQCISVIPFRSAIEGGIERSDVYVLTYASTPPVVVRIENSEVLFAETVASFCCVLHNSGLVFAVVKLGG